MNQIIEELLEKGIDVDSGMSYTGKGERYIMALQRFFEAYKEIRGNLQGFYEKKDAESFTILVHSVKSNAKMIGAKALSEKALHLELCGKEANWAEISSHISDFFTEYANVIEAIRPAAERKKEADGTMNKEQARKVAVQLLKALDDFDDEASMQLLTELMKYPFAESQRKLLEEAKGNIEEFMYDEATDLVGQVVPSLGE